MHLIAPDLRGFGESSMPESNYTKAVMAQDIHALATSLKLGHVRIVGQDIGLMVAYAYAAEYPAEVDRIALMDAFLPGVGDWQSVWLLRADLLRALLERLRRRSVALDPRGRSRLLHQGLRQAGRMRAGFEVFHAFPQDAVDFAQFAKTPLTMPMLVPTEEATSQVVPKLVDFLDR